MTQYFTQIAEVKYKDRRINLKIPIRIKLLQVEDYYCDVCKESYQKKDLYNNKYENWGVGMWLDERKKQKNEDVPPNACPKCKQECSKKPKFISKIYTTANFPYIETEKILSKVTPYLWRRETGKYFSVFHITTDDLKTIQEKFNKMNIKTLKTSYEELIEDYENYKTRKVAGAI